MAFQDNTPALYAPLSKEIYSAYCKLVLTLNELPERQFRQKTCSGTGGKVSPADIVAYQIGWGSLLITWYEAGLTCDAVIMPGAGFTTWNYAGLAQHFYTEYANTPRAKLMKTFKNTVDRVIEITECEYKSGNLDKLGVWHWCRLKSGKEWPLSKWIRVNSVSPYKRAYSLLRS
jgi:hypothetical protein